MIIPKNERNKDNLLHVKLHELWRSMMNRCYSEKNGSYKNYGDEGVTVDESWHSYDGFLSTIDLVDGFDADLISARKLQLDKDIKFKGNKTYSYQRCKFVTASENSANRRNRCDFVAIHLEEGTVLVTYNREKFCRDHGLDSSTVFRILKNNANQSHNYKCKKNLTHKGWVFFYPKDFCFDKLPSKQWYSAENIDTGELFYIDNIRGFAIKEGINVSSAHACVNGRQQRAGNWKIKRSHVQYYKDSTTIERNLAIHGIIR